MAFCHYPRCNAYCADPEHAILVMALPNTPYTAFMEFAASFGGQIRFAKPVPEIDAEAHGKTLTWNYTTGTGTYEPIPPQADPAKIVWRLHIDFRHVQTMPPAMVARPAPAARPPSHAPTRAMGLVPEVVAMTPLRRWWQALSHWWLRLRLRDLQAQRNLICRLATGHPYDTLHAADGTNATRDEGGEGGGERVWMERAR